MPDHITQRALSALRLGYPLTVMQLSRMLDVQPSALRHALDDLRRDDRVWHAGWHRDGGRNGKRRERLWMLSPAESIPRASDWACR